MPNLSTQSAGELALTAVKSAMDKTNIPDALRSLMVGHFCNAWNLLSTSQFDESFDAAYAGLHEFHPDRLTAAAKESIRAAVYPTYTDTGNAQSDYEAVRDAIERQLGKLSLAENFGERVWSGTCGRQGWNDESKLIQLEEFLRSKGLFAEFSAFAAKAADAENSDSPADAMRP